VHHYPRSLTEKGMVRLKAITKKVAPSFDLSGPCVCNTQVIKKPAAGPDNEPQLKVTEYSIQASHSLSCVSKVLDHSISSRFRRRQLRTVMFQSFLIS
jgi:carbamoyl-phosphate synthase large subunit